MKLLVTNTQSAQAYSIIRALRPYATKIVATMEGNHRWAARTAHAANSRFVDSRYYVPRADWDWHAGIIQKENTEREEAYIQQILKICRQEQIDTIFPSHDALVYVFSKNRRAFEDMGILIPVPCYETLLTPLDKYRTIKAAQRVGFPCPRTYVPENSSDLVRITRELDPPWVLKRRFTVGGEGMAFFTDLAGELRALFCPKSLRDSNRLHSGSASVESAVSHPLVPQIERLVRDLQWWGALTIQTKVDIRDGMPKLLEMNPRLGLHLWYRTELGCNEPLMCLKVAQGEEVPEFCNYPLETLLLEPLEDTLRVGLQILDLLVYKFRTKIRGMSAIDPYNAPLSVTDLVRVYKRDYFGTKRKVFSPYWSYLLDDPLPCLLWWYAFAGLCVRNLRTLGR